MQACGPETIEDAIRRIDAKIRRLNDFKIDLSRPGVLERTRARAGEMRRQYAELQETRKEADRFLPEILQRYRSGSDADREALRELLLECQSFRWGFGWGFVDRIAGEADARNALALFAMKDGGSDWRDQIVALDRLCATLRRAGLKPAPLLTEAARWSSDVARFPNARSTRARLLDYARRFGGEDG
jgi:hypothetical protein